MIFSIFFCLPEQFPLISNNYKLTCIHLYIYIFLKHRSDLTSQEKPHTQLFLAPFLLNFVSVVVSGLADLCVFLDQTRQGTQRVLVWNSEEDLKEGYLFFVKNSSAHLYLYWNWQKNGYDFHFFALLHFKHLIKIVNNKKASLFLLQCKFFSLLFNA